MKQIKYGRKIFSFGESGAVLESTSITERALPNEDEATFTSRLFKRFQDRQGTIEVVFKNGRPDYAIITFRKDQE